MKLRVFALPVFLLALAITSNCQQGPTKPSVQLTWVQSTTSGVTANCIYRGTVAGTYALPALFCSTAPITSYVDNTVLRNFDYHYAVTAKVTSTEGNFSNDADVPVPAAPNAPTGLAPATVTLLRLPGEMNLTARVIWGSRR